MKEKLSISADEQELHINYCPSEMGKRVEIYTTIPHIMKNLEKLVKKYPEQYQLIRDDQYSYTVSAPYNLIKPRAPRQYSEETMTAMKERLKNARETK